MLKNKRTKVMLWVLGGLVVVAAGVFIYGSATGSLKSSASTTTTFSDVPSSYWAYDAIKAVSTFNIANGYADGTFKPTQTVSQGQAAVFLARAVAGGDYFVPAGSSSPHCSDVPTTHWAYKYVEYLISQGVVGNDCAFLGTNLTPGKFYPDQIITRQDLAVILAKAAYGDSNVPNGPATSTFSDVSVDNYAYNYIENLYSRGVVSGYPGGIFKPTQTVTRDQMAVFIYNVYNLKTAMADLQSITSGSISAKGLLGKVKVKSYSGTLSGTVTDKKTGKPISGAIVTIKNTNGKGKLYGLVNLDGTNTAPKTDANGKYSVSLLTRKVGTVDVPLLGTQDIDLVFKYDIKATATGYKDSSVESASWPDSSNGAAIGPKDFALDPGNSSTHLACNTTKKTCESVNGTEPDTCKTDADCGSVTGLTGYIYITTGPACVPANAGCLINLTIDGSAYSTLGKNQMIDIIALPAGSHQITAGSLRARSGKLYNLFKVGGASLPVNFSVTSGKVATLNLQFK